MTPLWFLLCMLEPFAVENRWLFLPGPSHVLVVNPNAPEQPPRRLEGRLLGRSGAGLILESEGKWSLWSYQSETAQELPRPPGLALPTELPFFNYPGIFSSQTLWIYDRGWRSLPVPILVEYREPNAALHTQHGVNLIFPQVVSTSASGFLVYQGKTGEAISYASLETQGRRRQHKKKLRLLAIGDRLLWVGNKSDHSLELCERGTPFQPIATREIEDLEKDSPLVVSGKSIWLLTFDVGLGSLGEVWQTSQAKVQPIQLIPEGRRLQRYEPIGEERLPIQIQIQTSESGSLKLEIQPQFEFLPVSGWEGLVILVGNKLHWFTAKEPMREEQLQEGQEVPVAVSASGGKLWLWDGKGKARLWQEKK